MNSASGKESPTDTANACAASALAGAADFGAGRAGTVFARNLTRRAATAKPFLVFGAADGEPEFGALLGALAFEPVPEVGPPNTPNELVFAVCPQPPEPGRTGHTPAALGVGTRGAGMDGFAVCVVVSGGGTDGNGARIGGGGPAGGGGATTGAVLSYRRFLDSARRSPPARPRRRRSAAAVQPAAVASTSSEEVRARPASTAPE